MEHRRALTAARSSSSASASRAGAVSVKTNAVPGCMRASSPDRGGRCYCRYIGSVALMPFSRTTSPQRASSAGRGTGAGPRGRQGRRLICCVSVSCRATRSSFHLCSPGRLREAVDQRLPVCPGREHAPPGVGFEAGKACFDRGAARRECRLARLAGLHQRPQACRPSAAGVTSAAEPMIRSTCPASASPSPGRRRDRPRG